LVSVLSTFFVEFGIILDSSRRENDICSFVLIKAHIRFICISEMTMNRVLHINAPVDHALAMSHAPRPDAVFPEETHPILFSMPSLVSYIV
jgi:hypothetical protein